MQLFPEEWYQHGYIESQRPVTANYAYYDEGSYDGGMQSDDTWVPRWEDDRMGMMEHPTRGTYREITPVKEKKINSEYNILRIYFFQTGSLYDAIPGI